MLINSLQIVDSFVKKEVDTPTFTLQLIQGDEPFLISETAVIRLILESNGNNIVNKLIEADDNLNGTVSFEINEKLGYGTFDCEIIVTDNNETMTFPTVGYQAFTINRNLKTSGTGETIEPSEFEIILERLDSIDNMFSTKANATHTHPISDVTNLQTTLDNKSNIGHTHAITDVTGLNDTLTEHQDLINQLDIESDAHETRLNSIESAVQTTDTLTNAINEISDNAGNIVEVTNVQGNTLQNVLDDANQSSISSQQCEYEINGEYATITKISTKSDGTQYENGHILIHLKNTELLKPNTTYTMFFKEITHENKNIIIRDQTNGVNLAFFKPTNNKVVFTTNENKTNYIIVYYLNMLLNEKARIKNNIMVLEGDWTNRTDILDYFTGIESVNNPVKVKSIGKNLFNGNLTFGKIINSSTGAIEDKKTGAISDYIEIDKNKSLLISGLDNNLFNLCAFYDENKNFVTRSSGGQIPTRNFKTTKLQNGKYLFENNIKYMIVYFYEVTNITTVSISNLDCSNLQIEYNTTATSYEPYKESTLQIPINEPLRSLPNGVCDYIADGKIVRNVGKVVLNGTETWASTSAYDGFYRFACSNLGLFLTPTTQTIIGMNDKIFHRNNEAHGGYEYLYLQGQGQGGTIYIQKSDITTTSDFKTWLQSNNITVYYQLVTPTIESIEYEPILQTYQDGHILLENTPIKPKVNVTYSIGLNGRLQTIESQLAKEIEETNNVFDANDVISYWNGGTE